MDAAEFINLQQRRQHLVADTAAGMRRAGLHGWLLPTVPHTATPVADLKTVEDVALWNARTFRITRLANLFDQVAISIPSPTEPAGLPVGLQLSSPSRSEARLLAMAVAIERSLRGQAGATADLANRVGASGARA